MTSLTAQQAPKERLTSIYNISLSIQDEFEREYEGHARREAV
jgi:hypothetical protein